MQSAFPLDSKILPRGNYLRSEDFESSTESRGQPTCVSLIPDALQRKDYPVDDLITTNLLLRNCAKVDEKLDCATAASGPKLGGRIATSDEKGTAARPSALPP